MILDAYLDDSGTHSASETVTVAGYLSTTSRWQKFESEWRDTLNDFGLEFFRMSAFAHRVDAFRGWSEDQRQTLLQRLIEIINRNAGMSVGVAFHKRLFDSILSEAVKAYVGGPYGLAFSFVLMDVAKQIPKVDYEARVAYVLESGTGGAREIQKVYQEGIKDPSYAREVRLLSLRFGSKRQFLPLQAADILAYELFKHLPKQPTSYSATRYPLRELSKIPRCWSTPDEESLKNVDAVIRAKISLRE